MMHGHTDQRRGDKMFESYEANEQHRVLCGCISSERLRSLLEGFTFGLHVRASRSLNARKVHGQLL